MITEAIRNGPAFAFLVLGIIIIFGPLIAERLVRSVYKFLPIVGIMAMAI